MPEKQVSQETFDAVVREAMADFGLSPSEALAEARSQLALAGVTDFSNLAASEVGGSAAHPATALVASVAEAATAVATAGALDALADAARARKDVRGVAGAGGGVETVMAALKDRGERAAAWRAVAALCEGCEVNRGRFLAEDGGMDALVGDIVECGEGGGGRDLVLAALDVVRVVLTKSEDAKVRFTASMAPLESLVQLFEGGVGDAGIVRACAGALRPLMSADDRTKLACETFNRARVLCGTGSVTASGLRPLSGDAKLPELLCRVLKGGVSGFESGSARGAVADCIALARVGAVSDEICEAFMELGMIDAAFAILEAEGDDTLLARPCFSLLRSIAGRDQAQAPLASQIPLVTKVLLSHPKDASLAERYCGLVAATCLRRPDLSSRMEAEASVISVIVQLMETFASIGNVQCAGCSAFRNLAVRNDGMREKLRGNGGKVERLIRAAWKQYPVALKELAYNALYTIDVLEDSEMRRDRRYTTPF